MAKRITQKEFISRCKDVPSWIDLSNAVYRSRHTKVEVTCTMHNNTYLVFPATLYGGGTGCKFCANEATGEGRKKYRTSVEELKSLFEGLGKPVDPDFDTYKGKNVKMRFYCRDHDFEFWMTPSNFEASKHCCPHGGQSSIRESNRLGESVWLRRFRDKFGDRKIKWNGELCQGTLVEVFCERHGWRRWSTIESCLASPTACQQCSWNKTADSQKLSVNRLMALVSNLEWFGTTEYDFDSFTDTRSKMRFVCKTCDTEYRQRFADHLRWKGCPKCSGQMSGFELEVGEFIESFYSGTIIRKDKSMDPLGRETDILLPDIKLGIEANGILWHSSYARGIVGTDRNYHRDRIDAAKSAGYGLMMIWEDLWKHNKDIMKSIISSRIGVHDVKIGARSCNLEVLDKRTADIFFNINHIQGTTTFDTVIGLVYRGEVVFASAFLRNTLVRSCSKLSHRVAGAGSKILKHFLMLNKNLRQVYTYCDKSLFDCSGYISLGFVPVKEIPPAVSYVKGNYRYHSRTMTKEHWHKLAGDLDYDKSLTLIENWERLGCWALFDAGKIQFCYYRS